MNEGIKEEVWPLTNEDGDNEDDDDDDGVNGDDDDDENVLLRKWVIGAFAGYCSNFCSNLMSLK